ncbi:MAG: Gfo/Idh/MocA family oxidoreductase [Caldilineaceae bacterium]|nr:Gfo/Idh/MocA family oxidoreductase [Caldilineaceae bacterium]
MKVIQVGIGGMGNAWLRAVQSSPVVEYAGFVEVNAQVAAEQVTQYGLDGRRIYKSLGAALREIEADGVINVTPPQFHKAVSIEALEAGLPVLSEKPLADTRETAQAIVDAANRTGVLHMVTQNYRYKPPIQTLKQALASGVVGEIGAVHVEFFKGPHFGGFREEMPYPLIIDMAIHHFDLMRFFLGSDPVAIFGRSWNPPWSWFKGDASAAVLLTFANGVTVSYDGSWCSQGRETDWNANWRFEGSQGVVAMVNSQVFTQLTGAEAVPVATVAMERTDQAYLLHEFYEAVTHGKAPVTTCQDNIKSLGIVFDVVRSFERGAVVHAGV